MKRFSLFVSGFLVVCISFTALAQTKISGKVNDEKNEGLAGVNIIIKGRVIGTVTDLNGNFALSVSDNPPMTMVISFIGYATQEIPVTNANTSGLTIKMEESTLLGQEIVVSASRVEERIMESPVSIEKMDILGVQNTPADNYYKGLANLKGVDVTTSSINFQIINMRGFGSTGNTRFVQLIDGMDTQAPALNFPIGNLNGPSELDVESVEMIPGASSALYGPNAFNGILLINSKNPFDYQGLSAFAKSGVNHVNDANAPASPVWEGALRYAKAFNNKLAFKVSASYSQALDWYGTNDTDREIARTPAGFDFNPGADRLHYMGDEAAIPLSIFRLSANKKLADGSVDPNGLGWEALATKTIGVFEPGITAWDYSQQPKNWLPAHVVSVTPWMEKDLIDYNAKNTKLNGGLYYRINDKVELSYLYNGGFGTSIYTGAQRYSLKNFSIQQHRIQLRGDNFYVRAYTTLENSGDSYIVEFLAKRLNDIRSGGNVSSWLGSYGIHYLKYLYDHGYRYDSGDPNFNDPDRVPVDVQQAAHQFARTTTDTQLSIEDGRFEARKKEALGGVVPIGPKFKDATGLYHAEGQYDFKNQIKFMELQTGGSFRMFDLNSNGTIFDDATRNVTIKEFGAYAQAGKWFGDRKFKLSGSVRYDKNQNFKGRTNPRISGVFKASDNHTLRLSYQTGFRIPSTQGQHIDLDIISARLLGGLPYYADKYNLFRRTTNGQYPLSFEGFSVQEYSAGVFAGGATDAAINNPANVDKLKEFTWVPVKPEQINSIEVGYKGILNNALLVDVAYYYNRYRNFISQVRVRLASEYTTDPALNGVPGYSYTTDGTLAGRPNYATILNGTSLKKVASGIEGNTAQIYTNYTERLSSQGAVVGLTYNLPRGYVLGGNYNWNVLIDAPDPQQFMAEFNTPEHKINFSFGNRKLTDNFGFNLNFRWQSEFEWQSSFTIPANGPVPAYTTLDAQLSYRLSSLKSVLKVGGSNLLNKGYTQSGGGPTIGGLYYISLTFDELFR